MKSLGRRYLSGASMHLDLDSNGSGPGVGRFGIFSFGIPSNIPICIN
jgi:hypothetical protein